MKVVLFSGSRREKGCTYTALNIVAGVLNAAGIETEIFFVGGRVLKGETDAVVHEAKEILKSADAMVYGSPVYYASPSGETLMFLDRLYGLAEAELLFKPAATVASARRAGTSATLDALNKYPAFAQQPLVTSRYWNMVHGSSPEDVLKDEDKQKAVPLIRQLVNLGYELYATRGTSTMLYNEGIKTRAVFRISRGRPNLQDLIHDKEVQWIVNTTESIRSESSENACVLI